MAVVQSNYANRMAPYVAGMIVNQELHNSTSRLLEDAIAVGFGRAMFSGTGDDQVTATPSADFEGITIRDVLTIGAVPDTFEQGDTLPLCRLGVIAVDAAVAVAKNDPVYVTSAGAFTNVSTSNTLIAGATFDATITAAGVVPVRLK